jgi:predicted ester cyclase
VHPLSQLMRDYTYEFVNRHDTAVCDRLMADDYELHTGGLVLHGRDDGYKPASQSVYDRFPTLTFTVHRLVSNGDRVALHFSEHGLSVSGRAACWAGIALYEWDGSRLTRCWVEQDFWARYWQLKDGMPNAVEPPGLDPWSPPPSPPCPAAEAAVRSWLDGLDARAASLPCADDNWTAQRGLPALSPTRLVVNDLFSAGPTVCFHVTQFGMAGSGQEVGLHLAGIATAGPRDKVHPVRIISSRAEAFRAGAAPG